MTPSPFRGGRPVDSDEDDAPPEVTSADIAARRAASRATDPHYKAKLAKLVELRDQLSRAAARNVAEAPPEAMEKLREAIAVLTALADAAAKSPTAPPDLSIPWGSSSLSADYVLEAWDKEVAKRFADASLEDRARALMNRKGEDLWSPQLRIDEPAPWWRIAASPASAVAYREAEIEATRLTARAAKIQSEIDSWLKMVTDDDSLLQQNAERLLHRKDAIAALEAWLWTIDGGRWRSFSQFTAVHPGDAYEDKDRVKYTPSTTISPEAFPPLERLREHLAALPSNLGGVSLSASLIEGYCQYQVNRKRGSLADRLRGFRTVYGVRVEARVGELGFAWLVELVFPHKLLTSRPRERPEVVFVQRAGSVQRAITNVPSLRVRVMDLDAPRVEGDEPVTLPGEPRPVYLWQLTGEVNHELLDVVRAHAPRRARSSEKE